MATVQNVNHDFYDRFPLTYATFFGDSTMSIETKITDPETEAILDRVRGKPLDPVIYNRIREEGARITEEIRKKFGTRNIAVELVREARDQCD